MKPFSTMWLLAVVTFLFGTATPQAFASWSCEGRTCGTALSCCCISPVDAQDGNCGVSGSGSVRGATACGSNCNCVLTVQAAAAARPVLPVVLTVVDVASLTPPVTYGPTPVEVIARTLETRGPPLQTVILASPSLRGPPSADVPTLGSLSGNVLRTYLG